MTLKQAAERVVANATPLNYGDVKGYGGRGFLITDADFVALSRAVRFWLTQQQEARDADQ